jgi:acetolactate synthase-1/2/3 large subunit
MARKRSELKVDRRKFLTGMAMAGTATAVAASQQAANAASGASLQSDAVRPTPSAVHATMAIYNAWCDRAPVIVMGGNDLDASKRPPGVPTIHSAQDINALVRDFTKWDDTPVSLEHFAQSVVRAYKIAMTPPHAPVMIALDAELQEETVHNRAKLSIPKLTHTRPPQADLGAIRETAKLLVGGQMPVIVVDRVARTPNA